MGKTLRIAPGHRGIPTALFWKFWISGNEVYALNRSAGGRAKFSFHESGQIHIRMEGKDLDPLASPVNLGNGTWHHVYEVRFFITEGAHRPPFFAVKDLANRAYLIDAKPNDVVTLNLLVGQIGTNSQTQLPHEFPHNNQVIWRSTLKDKRPVIMVARGMPLDGQNAALIAAIQQLKPTVNFENPPKTEPYFEFMRLHSNPLGNVIMIMPLTKENYRPGFPPVDNTLPARQMTVVGASAVVQLLAPNGATVGTLAIEGKETIGSFAKNADTRLSLGTVTLSINSDNLICGESFESKRQLCPCFLSIDGNTQDTWKYSLHCAFDGNNVSVVIAPLSTGLRNANFKTPFPQVNDHEQIIVVAPTTQLTLSANSASAQSTTELMASFVLIDI